MSKAPRSAGNAHAASNVEILLRNVRLLDLDEEFDWPFISCETFAAGDSIQNQKKRIRSAEWVLYKLFQVWDSDYTSKNLEPYFPALEPLQSANLRAVLFRALNDLKKNGIFNRDIFIRKSMLDDCKGSKFEDMLAALSTAVLRKVLADDEKDKSVAKKIVLDRPDSHSYFRSMLPLAIGYKVTMKRHLQEKRVLEQRYRSFGRLLDMKDNEIAQRTHDLSRSVEAWKERSVPRRTVDKLRKHIDLNWYGDKEWVDVLTRSDLYKPTNNLIERPFEKVWQHVRGDTLHKLRPHCDESLLRNLERRVAAQNDRLDRWRNIHETLEKARILNESPPSILPGNLETQLQAPSAGRDQRVKRTPVVSIYATPSVRGDKNNLHDASSLRSDAPVNARSQRCLPDGSSAAQERAHIVPSNQAFPESFQSGVSSNHQSNVNTPSSSTDGSLSFILLENADDEPSSSVAATTGQLAHIGGAEISALVSDGPRSPTNELTLPGVNTNEMELGGSKSHTDPLRTLQNLSLVERTRMSMALMSPQKNSHASDSFSVAALSLVHAITEDPDHSIQSPIPALSRFETLLERTRQSMSLMPSRPQGRRASHKPRTSIVYPTNQFESPRKKQSSSEAIDASILEETMPDLDVDYETVFKSRPKIALSPRLKPVADEIARFNEHSMESRDMEASLV